MESPEQFLHQKDPALHISDPVEYEQTQRARAGEEVHQKPADKIADWMRVLEETHMGHPDNPEVLERIKDYYKKEYVITPDEVPEAAYLLEQRIARNLGHGTVEITNEYKEKKQEEIIHAQEESLDKWVDYLTSPDAQYPIWAKYWAFTQMVNMGKFEKAEDEEGKESARFAKREKNTVAPFPPLNPRALGMVVAAMEKRITEQQKAKGERMPVPNTSTKLFDEEFATLLAGESFPKLYTQFLIELPAYSKEGLEETRGEWVTYPQHSDPTPLVRSLDGYPLEWCTANMSTAQTQLEGGDFFVYYSINQDGEAVIPRAAIRMQEGSIAEVRGIAPNQNIDPFIAPVIALKMKEFPDGASYEKKSEDMRYLTLLEQKTKKGESFSKEDLTFLYEVDTSIEGFGYKKDPRIKELRDKRNPGEDMPMIFGCTKEQIAHNEGEVTTDTIAYVGTLSSKIFQSNIEHIYTTFPEGKLQTYNIEIGGKAKEEYLNALTEKNIKIGTYAQQLLESPEFVTLPSGEHIALVRLTVFDLGLSQGATTDEIYKRANEWGLELCPPEVGPALRLATDNPEWMRIGIKQISVRDGYPNIFNLYRNDDGLWLNTSHAEPSGRWSASYQFVFRIRKSDAG
ncbi:MAG: hypothetical protein A3C14_00355 [Candidatus Lloydbacteria bacterium RIFCSPHIGHO2_02_FULL_50_18]|nr:MAG: hypothetical protein A3C14_00355 [Candidatus Lloydbacteria bacterium RIFCSPHIGHO2_02_FULL_50_18]